MKNVILVILFGLILCPDFYTQQIFGHRIFGENDILSDVFLIKEGSVLDSVVNNSITYKFEYDDYGKLIRDINFLKCPVRYYENGQSRIRLVPGYRNYSYNERGDIDSILTTYWNDTSFVCFKSEKINYTYDSAGRIITKTFSVDGNEIQLREEYYYNDFGSLILNMTIFLPQNDTIFNTWEFDSLNRLILKRISKGAGYEQYIYEYDSEGNINCAIQEVDDKTVINLSNYYLSFDENERVVYQIQSNGFNSTDSTWDRKDEITLSYDEGGRIISMGNTCSFCYNSEGNLDSLIYTHVTLAGYLADRAKFIDSYGNEIILPNYGGINCFYYSEILADLEGPKDEIEKDYHLAQNYPNPFNPTTKISFSIPKENVVSIKISDVLGREVSTLLNEFKKAGRHEITFNSADLSSGVYFYTLSAGDFIQTKKFLLLK